MELSAEEKEQLIKDTKKLIASASLKLLNDEPHFFHFFCKLNKIYDFRHPTIGVTILNHNYVIIINPVFITGINHEDITKILKHEMLHLLFSHPVKIKEVPKEDVRLYNVACDLSVNCFIKDPPEGALLAKNFGFKNYKTADYYYDELNNSTNNIEEQVRGCHDDWNEDYSDGEKDDSGSSDNNCCEEESDEGDKLAEINLNTLLKEVEDDFNSKEFIKKYGELSHNLKKNIYINKKNENKLNWKSILKRYIYNARESKELKTRSRPNRRASYFRPGVIKKPDFSVAIIADTSGSISEIDFKEFVTEMFKINKFVKKMWFIQCDVDVVDLGVFSPELEIQRYGYGGTEFEKALRYTADKYKPDLIVYFTDGIANFNFSPINIKTLWVLTNNKIFIDKKHGVSICMHN